MLYLQFDEQRSYLANSIVSSDRNKFIIWQTNRLYTPREIGNLSELRKSTNSKSPIELYNNYIRTFGVDKLHKVAKKFMKLCECYEDSDYWLYYYYTLYHLFIETMSGVMAEEKSKSIIESNGYEIFDVSGDMDFEYGIDYVASNGKITYGIQVKPISFYTGFTSSLKYDTIELYKKFNLARNELGLIPKLTFYNKSTNKFIINPNTYSSVLWDYEELYELNSKKYPSWYKRKFRNDVFRELKGLDF